jgi:hypothetical protein
MPKNMLKYLFPFIFIISFWSLITPIFEFPDEQAHIESVEFIVKEGRMPAGEEWDMTAEMKRTQDLLGNFRDTFGNNKYTYHPDYHVEYVDSLIGKYEAEIKSLNTEENRDSYVWKEAARYPRLYYDYMTIWYRLSESKDVIYRIYVLRLGNVLLALATALIIYQSGLLIFAKKSYALTLTMLVMLQPMYSFLSAGINSDNLHNLLFAAIVYCGLRIVRNGLNLNILALTTTVVVLDIVSKPQGYIVLPIIIMAFLLHIIQTKKWKLLSILLAVGLLSLAAIFSPWNPYSSWVNSANVHGANLMDFVRFSLNKLVTQNIVWYWGVFKWLGIVLPPVYWQLANRVVLLGGLGLFVYLWKVIKKNKIITAPLITLYLLLATLIYVLAIYYFDWQYTKAVGYSIGVQARYFFPTISAQMALLMIGILSLGWTARVRIWLRRGLVLFIVWMQLGGLWRLITSYYDVSSVQSFITQASQYKPWFVKGEWWYLWIGLYIASILYLTWMGMVGIKGKKKISDTN